jgi:hypothetical protein
MKLNEILFKALQITFYALNLLSGLFKKEEYLKLQMFATERLEMLGQEPILKTIKDKLTLSTLSISTKRKMVLGCHSIIMAATLLQD